MSAEKMTPREKAIQEAFEETGVSTRRPVRGIVAKINGTYYPIEILKVSEDRERAFVEVLMGASKIKRYPLSWEKEREGNGWIRTKTIFINSIKFADAFQEI